ncbi:MAG: hypothetical protein ABI698_09800, partial [bacterium]
MKRIFIWLTGLSILFLAAAVPAQQLSQPAADDRIEVLKKQRAELDQQIIEELEKQIRVKQALLDQLRKGSSPSQSESKPPIPNTAQAPERQPLTVPLKSPHDNAASGTLVGDRTVADLAAVVSTVNQPNAKCFMVLNNPNNFSVADQSLCFLARDIVDRRIEGIGSGIDLSSDEGVLLPALFGQVASKVTVDAAVKSFVLDLEAARADKQFGSDPRTSGTTSLGVKGGIPTVLSWAVEHGGAVSSTDGNSVTFRVNPVGFAQALSSQGYISSFMKTETDPIISFLRKTSLGFSFDTTRGTNPPTLIGSKQQLSAVSFRYVFVNQRDPRNRRYRQLWDTFIANQGLAFTKQQSDVLQKLETAQAEAAFKNADLQKWVDQTNVTLGAISTTFSELNKVNAIEAVRTVLEQRLTALPITELDKDPTLVKALTDFVGAYLPYVAEKKRLLDEISKGTLITFEYTNFREPNAPDLSNLRFIAEKGTFGGFDFTGNASLTFFNRRPVGLNTQRLRDFDFSAQLDKKLNDVMGIGPATLSFTGRFQRLTSNAVAFDGTVLPITRGDIAAGQIKLMLPIKFLTCTHWIIPA